MFKKLNLFNLSLIGILAFFLVREVGFSIWNKIKVGTFTYSQLEKDNEKVSVIIHVPLINSGNVSIPLERFEGVLLYGNNVISNLSVPSPFTILANDTISVPIRANITYGDLAFNLFELIKSKKFKQPLRLKGVIKAKGFNIPINQNIDIPI